MKKKHGSVYGWCRQAGSYIRHPVDRKEVMEELQAHMDDRIEELTTSGMRYSEALTRVEAAMGDADEVGRQLRMVHDPLPAWILTGLQWMAGLLLVLTVWIVFKLPMPTWLEQLENRIRYGGEDFGFWAQAAQEAGGSVTELDPVSLYTDPATGIRLRLTEGYIADIRDPEGLVATVIVEADKHLWQKRPDGMAARLTFTGADGKEIPSALSEQRDCRYTYTLYVVPEGEIAVGYAFGSTGFSKIIWGGEDT